MEGARKILVIEDQSDLLEGLQRKLEREGYETMGAADGRQGVTLALQEQPDLILLDLMLPAMDGFEVCKHLRQAGLEVPIIMLTAKAEEIDKVVGLEIGADDYVTKPFSMRELLARIRVRLRSRHHEPGLPVSTYRIGRTEIDFSRFTATVEGEALALTSKEFQILQLLVRNRGKTVSREQLMSEVWHYSEETSTRTLDTHVLRLRQKLEEDPAQPRYIQTVYGAGYRLVE